MLQRNLGRVYQKEGNPPAGEVDELKLMLDDIANQLAGAYPHIHDWEQWLLYLLDGLELQAASLDREHPAEYEAMLARLEQAIHDRLKKGAW